MPSKAPVRLLPVLVLLCAVSGPAFGGVLGDAQNSTRAERQAMRQLLSELTAVARRACAARVTRPASAIWQGATSPARFWSQPTVRSLVPRHSLRVQLSRLNLPPPTLG